MCVGGWALASKAWHSKAWASKAAAGCLQRRGGLGAAACLQLAAEGRRPKLEEAPRKHMAACPPVAHYPSHTTHTTVRRDAAGLERFLEAWEPLLPPAVLQYIMESLVLPRLRLAVQGWDPLRDTVALHTWVHPWLVRLLLCWAGGPAGLGWRWLVALLYWRSRVQELTGGCRLCCLGSLAMHHCKGAAVPAFLATSSLTSPPPSRLLPGCSPFWAPRWRSCGPSSASSLPLPSRPGTPLTRALTSFWRPGTRWVVGGRGLPA